MESDDARRPYAESQKKNFLIYAIITTIVTVSLKYNSMP